MKYFNIDLDLNTPYKWGAGWDGVSEELYIKFNTRLNLALGEMEGHWLKNLESSNCQRYRADNPREELYVHPMEITGCVSEDNYINMLAGFGKYGDKDMSIARARKPQEVEFLSLQEVYERLEEHVGKNKDNLEAVRDCFRSPHGVPGNAINNLVHLLGEDIFHLKRTNFCDTDINKHLGLCEDLVYKYLQFRPFPYKTEYLKKFQEFCRENNVRGELVDIDPALYKEFCIDRPVEEKPNKDGVVQGINQTLITKEILSSVPTLYTQDNMGAETIAYAKFFTPNNQWIWYMTEYDPDTKEAFGWVEGLENELGYFSINEFVRMNKSFEREPSLSKPWIERDSSFKPCALGELKSYRDAFGLDRQEVGKEVRGLSGSKRDGSREDSRNAEVASAAGREASEVLTGERGETDSNDRGGR